MVNIVSAFSNAVTASRYLEGVRDPDEIQKRIKELKQAGVI